MLHFINNSTNIFNVYKSCCLKLDNSAFTCILINTLSKKEHTFNLTKTDFKIRIDFTIVLNNIEAGDYTFKLIQNAEIVYMEKLTVTRLENNVSLQSIDVELVPEQYFIDIFTFSIESSVQKYFVYKKNEVDEFALIYEFNYNSLAGGVYEMQSEKYSIDSVLITYKIEVLFNDNSIKTVLNGVMIPTAPNPPLLQYDNVI